MTTPTDGGTRAGGDDAERQIDRGARRFDGERWWVWDGDHWLLEPDWDAPVGAEDGDVRVGASDGKSGPARRGTALGMAAIIAVLLVAVAAVVWFTRAKPADFHDLATMSADIIAKGNSSAKSQGSTTTITAADCKQVTAPDDYLCTLTLSTRQQFQVTSVVSSDGTSYKTAVRTK
jgi:hypothetical protein